MKIHFPICAAVILAATVAQVRAQDDLDSLRETLKTSPTPAPVATATPRPSPEPAATSTSRAPIRAAATPRQMAAASKPTAAPAAPRETVQEQLARGNFIIERDLAGLAGKKVPSATFLTGTFKSTGSSSAGRKEFGDAGLLKGSTKLLIRFPVAPDPRILAAGYSSKWEKSAPLRVESVNSSGGGITIYATDVTP